VVDYDPFSLLVIHKEGLCPSSGDINGLMMMMMMMPPLVYRNEFIYVCKMRQSTISIVTNEFYRSVDNEKVNNT
jgi:hypothetical protein